MVNIRQKNIFVFQIIDELMDLFQRDLSNEEKNRFLITLVILDIL